MNVLVTGGAGYIGSSLIPYLNSKGHWTLTYDLFTYGNNLEYSNWNTNIKGDIRDTDKLKKHLDDIDTVIHLASISNDPSYELNPELGKSINYDCFPDIIKACEDAGVRRFIYASTSSVYGIKDEPYVTEKESCNPLTDYSKYKLECEKILLNESSMENVILRPATTCGWSPRMRFDLVVNILTIHALINRRIKVFGGTQYRPNINIDDIIRAYLMLVEADADKVDGEIFNCGYQNMMVIDIAKLVKDRVDKNITIHKESTDDDRSYHIDSRKIREKLGFTPEYTIEDAVDSICEAYWKGKIYDGIYNPYYHNIKMMRRIDLE